MIICKWKIILFNNLLWKHFVNWDSNAILCADRIWFSVHVWMGKLKIPSVQIWFFFATCLKVKILNINQLKISGANTNKYLYIYRYRREFLQFFDGLLKNSSKIYGYICVWQVCSVYKPLISDALFKKKLIRPDKYEVERHWGPKFYKIEI